MSPRNSLFAGLLAALTLAPLSGSALAVVALPGTSTASTDITLNFTLDSVAFASGPNTGTLADAFSDYEYDPYGYWESFSSVLTNTGAGSTSATASMTSGGVPPEPDNSFAFSPTDTISIQIGAESTAMGAGADHWIASTGQSTVYFQSYSDSDLLITFNYDWMRNMTLTNDVDGNHAVSFLDGFFRTDGDAGTTSELFIDGNGGFNIGNSTASTFPYSDNGSGQLTFVLGAGNYVSMTFGAELGASAEIAAVPEAETWAMMLAGLGILGVVASRRSSRAS